MPLIKLNRINKGGEILINSDHIAFIEVEGKSTTIHLSEGLLFSVEETLDAVAEQVERLSAARIANGIMESGVAANRD
jgi:uncharacterized protein YlzI (FlbEa/FlbD family)